MAYNGLTAAEIAAGKATKEEIFSKIKSNQDFFDSEIDGLKGTSNTDVFDIHYSGSISSYELDDINERAPIYKAPIAGTIVSFFVTLLEASTSGTLSIIIEKSTDNGINWTPMTSSPLELTGLTIGSTESTVTWSDDTIAQNDLVRVIIDSYQVDQGDFHISVYAEL